MLQRMNIAALFIRRPVATALIMLGMLFFGAASYVNLPVNQLPNVDFPTIQVSADLSGADPETMAASVATPLEKEFFTIAGIDSISSVHAPGRTRTTIQFALDRDIDAAALDVQAAIGLAQRRLPTNMTNDPSFRKVNPADYPILYLRVGSPTLPLYELNEYADTLVGQRLSMVKGVAQVVIYGQKKYAVRVRVDPDALASRGLGIDEVADAVSNANSKLPTGSLEGERRASAITASGQLEDAEAFRDVVAAYRNGAPVRLSDIGEVVDSVEQDKQLSWADDGKPCIMLAVERQPGANTVQVVDDIKTLLPGLTRQLPPSVKLEIFYDRSESIRESVAEVKFTLVLTVFLVVLVIFLFLRNLPATIIPSLALPMSVISTFAVMLAMGFSLDNLSLMALTLAVGFVVDDAIVMLENIVRHQEMGKDPLTAAYDGSGEIGFTILSMTVSLAAVFIPVLFMGGIVGRLFYEFAVVIITAILFSGVVSLTLTPMLCAYFLRHSSTKHSVGYESIYGNLERANERQAHMYARSLDVVLRHRRTTLIFSLLLLLATGWLGVIVPKGFLPSEDMGFVVATTEAEQGISFEGMVKAQHKLDEVLRNNPHVDRFNSVVGIVGSSQSMRNGTLMIHLKPHGERPDIQTVVQRLRRELNTSPAMQVFLRVPPAINIGGRSTKALYQYTLTGTNMQELFECAQKVEAALRLDRHVHVVKNVDELYRVSDYITIHIPYNNSTKDFINAESIAKMKGQVRILNLARGGLVNDDDMIQALESGRVARYVTDFPDEKIAVAAHVVALPHLGASTPESEENCARMAADQLKDYLNNGNIKHSVNLPNVAQEWSGISRVCLIHQNIPAMLTKITSILSKEGVNVENQTNKSKKDYAYTMVDLNSRIKDKVAEELRAIPGMIRVRVLNH